MYIHTTIICSRARAYDDGGTELVPDLYRLLLARSKPRETTADAVADHRNLSAARTTLRRRRRRDRHQSRVRVRATENKSSCTQRVRNNIII